MSDIRLEQAIKEINQNAEFSIREKDVDKITWLNGTSPISKDDILAKQTEYKQLMIIINIKEIEQKNIQV